MQEGSSLTIYGQPDGDGKLIATGDSGQAGIGGFNANNQDNAPITITIHGGNIQATGGGGGAGIGCLLLNMPLTYSRKRATATGIFFAVTFSLVIQVILSTSLLNVSKL